MLGLQCCQECISWKSATGPLLFLHIGALYFLTHLGCNLASRSQCRKHAKTIIGTFNLLVSRGVSPAIVVLHNERHMVLTDVTVTVSSSL